MGVNATEVVPPSFDELVNGADYVVRAKVEEVTSQLVNRGTKSRIVSKVKLEVLEVVAGDPPESVVLTVLGGQVGERIMTIEGAPQFVPGTEAIFFVQGNGRQFYPLVAMMHGLYPILKNGVGEDTYMARSNREPLSSISQISKKMGETAAPDGTSNDALRASLPAFKPTEFMERIRQQRVNPNPSNRE